MGVYSGFKAYHNFVILLSACLWPASNNSVNAHQNENRFVAFGSIISHAEVENAILSDCIIVCSKFSGI